MSSLAALFSRRAFVQRLGRLGVAVTAVPWALESLAQDRAAVPVGEVIRNPGAFAFGLPKGSIILVSDQQLRDLQDPDQELDLSLSAQPNRTTLRKVCQGLQASGGRTLILAFDEFWSQYRPGQGGQPRVLTPDTEEYVACIAKISETLKAHGLGLELSLLSPLEIGPAYIKRTGDAGRWVQYVEGWRDARTGKFSVGLWEQRHWTNNKGTIALQRTGVRVFAFRERRLRSTVFYQVNPAEILELKGPFEIEEAQTSEDRPRLRRLTVRGAGETEVKGLDRVLVVVGYQTPEMDYFSPAALGFLKDLVGRYQAAGVPLNGLYADEMHIQQDWGYNSHHDSGQFALRYLTPNFARRYAALYGQEFADLERFLVYFAYGQHGFLSTIDARLPAQHVMGDGMDGVHRTFLLRRRYFDLLEKTVVDLFAQAKEHAEHLYGHELESRAHATWAQSPTIDFWYHGQGAHAPRQYEYTSNFLWSNTVHQAASACSDYFRWNAFLTGGGNDHAEGGWSDRNYYGLALACSTGILNRTPNAYAAAWGMPNAALRRHHALEIAYGASAPPPFMALQDAQHRDTEVLMLYPISLVACEERFGSWMVQYGYANYVTAEKLLEHGRVAGNGWIEMAGRRFNTVCALFEPIPQPGLIEFLAHFAGAGGKVVWSGPPPQFDLKGASVLKAWESLFALKTEPAIEGRIAAGQEVRFEGALASVPVQTILTDFLVDRVYPAEPKPAASVVARSAGVILGTQRALQGGGTATFLGFRPRDDQAASLGHEVRTWFEILLALGAYPPISPDPSRNDNPAVVSRGSPWLATRFPNGTIVVAAHYKSHVEGWPGGFHRNNDEDEAILKANPLPPDRLELKALRVAGHEVDFEGTLVVGFRLDASGRLIGFSGRDCNRIRIDGQTHTFSDKPAREIAWAPVHHDRRIQGGAVLEIWIAGDGPVRIPTAADPGKAKLHAAGGRPGAQGEFVESVVKDGVLEFTAKPGWGMRHLYLMA
jgi:hypothetical protein